MQCIKCKAVLPEGSIFCNVCGKKQTATVRKTRTHKRASGMGTITKDKRYKNRPYVVRAPSTATGMCRVYIGAYPDMKSAQAALEDYMRNGRPTLYNATLADIYDLWSEVHFEHVGPDSVKLYTYMWKRFAPIQRIKMTEIRTIHFQDIINKATSRSAAETLKTMALQFCKFSMENDLISKNYAEFIKLPKFEKKEKIIFSDEQIGILWKHTDDKRTQAILSMIYMGFRIGELLMITPADVFFDEGYVISGEKTEAGKKRVIPFPPMIPEIKSFFVEWGREVPQDVPLWDMTNAKFRNDVFYATLIELGMVKASPRKGKMGYDFEDDAHLTPHSTRHTFASLSSKSGMRPEELQKIIGHANFQTTANVYIHKDIDALKDAMSVLTK